MIDMQGAAAALEKLIEARTAKIGIIGMGYVGVPLALAAIRAGYKVIGFDNNPERVKSLNGGKSGIKHIPDADVAAATSNGSLDATADADRLDEPDIIIICVPTPLTRHRDPDLMYVEQTGKAIARKLRKGQLVILESTTWPGTTEEVLQPILDGTGLKCKQDYFLAFSPEREDPGNENFVTATIPKVVGGLGPDALKLANAFYSKIVVKTVPVSSPGTAEAVKLTENIFRAVNIALVNELKVVYTAMGIDVWEVIEAAATKPFGFMPFYPGPGLGGHCIPIDPFYLSWKAREFDVATQFIELAGEVNRAMPRYVIDRLAESMDRRLRKGLNGSKIIVLGIAYKKNVDDMRESPSLSLIEMLEHRGAHVEFHDPHVPVVPMTREHAAMAGRKSVTLDQKTIEDADAILIATDHDAVDYKFLVSHAKLVADSRNACVRKGAMADNVVKV
jgi:UDP-N-acetyl-D-glucosamine dehydrogenase